MPVMMAMARTLLLTCALAELQLENINDSLDIKGVSGLKIGINGSNIDRVAQWL
jgi:hypothetical protein